MALRLALGAAALPGHAEQPEQGAADIHLPPLMAPQPELAALVASAR